MEVGESSGAKNEQETGGNENEVEAGVSLIEDKLDEEEAAISMLEGPF